MLDQVDQECARPDARFLEPACGDGNFLAEILERKLSAVTRESQKNIRQWERDAFVALSSLYGIDLLPDNVERCRERLLSVVTEKFTELFCDTLSQDIKKSLRFVLKKNVIQGDALQFTTDARTPIVFSEWSAINASLVKRRDFKFEHLIAHADIASTPLFNDLGHDVFLPTPAGEYPPCPYQKVWKQKGENE